MSQMLLPNPLYTNHYGESGRGLSPRLWSKIGAHGAAPDGSQGIFISDDFLVFGESVAASSNIACYASSAGQYKAYIDTTSTVAQLETAGSGGVVKITLEAAANEEASLCQGGAGTSAATSVLGALNRDTSPKLTIFESRFKVSSVADDVLAIFVGLMEENGAVHNAKVDTTGVTIDNDFIGFNTIHYNSGTAVTSTPTITPVTGQAASLQAVYKKDGQTLQVPIAAAGTLVADTWIKAGFVYDPAAPASKRIAFYVNNVEQTTYVTDTDMNASTFPDGEEMGFTAIAKTGAATTGGNLQLDWWAFYQEV
jgi:hypothetical protein